MTTIPPSLSPESAVSLTPAGPTLADVLARIAGFGDVSAQARQNMASAVRSFCRVLDRPPGLVPIAAPSLRRAMEGASPGAFSISPARWRNVKSDVRRAIRLSGLSTAESAPDAPLSEPWEALALRGTSATERSMLRRVGRYCSARQIGPEQVDDGVIAEYLAYLDTNQLSRIPHRSVGDLLRLWNRHVATDPSGRFRLLTRPSRDRKYCADWCDLPASLHEDVQAYHEASRNPDPLDPDARRAVAASTIAARDSSLRRIAAAEIQGGVRAEELRSLADLVHPDRLKPGLRYFLDRNGGEPSKQLADILGLVLGIARHWVKAPDEQVNKIRAWEQNFRWEQRGLTDKNRERLRQFTDERVLRAFVNLPGLIVAKARKQPLNYTSARRVQTALAIALLLIAPVRIANLAALDRQRHFQWARFEGRRMLHLVIPAAEVKNDVDLEYPVPPLVEELLDLYFAVYQPLLTNGQPSSLLFPGRKDGHKQVNGLRRQIVPTIQDEAGLNVNLHLFRHLAAMLFLEKHPGHYEEVRRLLGHRSLTTTIQSYAGMETIGAARRYDAIILGLQDDAAPERASGRGSRKDRR